MPVAIALMTFLAVLAVLVALTIAAASSRRDIAVRLNNYVELPAPAEAGGQLPTHGRVLAGWRSSVRRLSRYFESPRASRSLEHKLVQAGLLLRMSEFMVICAGMALLGGILLLALSGGKVAAAIIGGCGGFLMPRLVLHWKAVRRIRRFNDQLGDALILVANSLRTGYSFLQAIEMVAREMPEPVAGEFARTLKEMALGVTTEQAMNHMARRVDSDDLDLVVTAVLIQRQVGGNLSEVLDNIAGTIRARVKLKGEIRTLTAQGRTSGIILSLLPIVVGFGTYLVNPGYISLLFSHPLGQALVGGAVVSLVLGALFIRRIVNINI